LKKTAPKVFLYGSRIDIDYVRTEITFVNYVRDGKEADVYALSPSSAREAAVGGLLT
jgi:hypothetical protein